MDFKFIGGFTIYTNAKPSCYTLWISYNFICQLHISKAEKKKPKQSKGESDEGGYGGMEVKACGFRKYRNV